MPPIDEYFSLKSRYRDDKVATVDTFKTFHIMCEGTVTEVKYFNAIKNSSFLNVRNGIVVKLLKRTVSDKGRTQLLEMYQLMKNYILSEDFNEGDIPVLVVDFDGHKENTNFQKEIKKIQNNGIEVYGNSPCIELWLILHYPDTVDTHIIPYEKEHFENIRVSNNHTFTSKMASDILGFNPKSKINSTLLNGIDNAMNQSSRLENELELLNKKIGTNFQFLISKIVLDERFI